MHSFLTASATSMQTGIFIPNTGNSLVYNNMVRLGIDASGAAQTNSVQINGIYKVSSGNVGIYFNSVYIGGSGVASGAVNTYAYRRGLSGPADTVMNNIFINNRSNASGTGKHYGIFTNAFADLVCNFNLYQTTGTGGVFGINNITDYATIAAWRGATNLDNASGYGDPNFVSPTGTSTTVDLHVQSNTAIEAAGTPLAAVTNDYDGAGRAGLTPVDIGADAGNFTSSGDIFPPNILYTTLTNGTSANRVLTNFATITDNVAVSVGASLPRIYYKKSTDANAFVGNTSADNGWKFVIASNSSSPYSFTINYSIIFGGSVVNGNIIQYFVVAQDAANNLGSNYGGAAASGNPPVQNINLAPVTPLSYTIAASISGTLTVGSGGTYPSLTGAAGAFAAINAATVTSNLIIQVLSDLTEDGTNALNPLNEDPFGSNFTVTIQPNSTTERLISGAVANGMIRLFGTDRITIDGRNGGSGKYLRFRNTNTSNPTFTFLNDATNNTIRNCYIEGANTGAASGVVLLSTTTGTTGNDNNTFTQNVFRNRSDAAGVPANLVYSSGTALKENSDLTFSNNEFLNFSNAGLTATATGNGNNWTISANSFYNNLATPPSTAQTAINFIPGTSSSNNTISGNYIGGQAVNCGGSAWTNTGAVAFYGIFLTTGIVTPSSVQNNTIQNITMSSISSGSFAGIYITGGDINIGTTIGNTIGHPSTAGSITLAGTSASRAIYNSGTGYINILNNLCSNINWTSTTASVGFRTIEILGGTVNITNNTIRDIASACPSTWTDYDAACVGIEMRSALPGLLIENNTIYNLTASNVVSTSTVTAHAIRVAAGVGSVLRNNIYNIVNQNPNSAANLYGINIVGGIWRIANNLISLGTGTGNQVNISGIFDNSININDVYFNSINISGTATSGANSTFAFNKNSSSFLTSKNNILFNQRTGGTGLHYSIKIPNTTSFVSNYNDLFATGVQLGAIGGTNYASLATWQTGALQDANSVSANPQFVSTTDLHTIKPELNNAGVTIAGITTDYANVVRANPPDIGAYEFTLVPTVTTLAATAITGTGATLNGSANPQNEGVMITSFEYGLTVGYGSTAPAVPTPVSGVSTVNISAIIGGLTPSTLYHFRAKGMIGATPYYGLDLTFTTLALPPTVVTTAATAITATTVTLNGTVNANNSSTTVSFDYGLTAAYGTNVPGVPVTVTGSSVTAVLANLTGLLPCTLYHFRVNGLNAGGIANGSDLTFTTLPGAPTAVTVAATLVTTTSATLNGTINANCLSTTVTFDYGLTVAYGTTVPGIPSPVTANTTTSVSAAISSLVGNNTYHYRVNGVNSNGTTHGNDMTFTTVCPISGPAGPITGPTQVCQGGCGYVYSVTIPEATGYVWTLPVGGTITAGANTNTITVCYAANASPGYVFVYGTAACGNGAPSQLAVAMNPPAAPTLSGPASVCVNSAGNVYTTQSGMSNYVWTVSAGGNITNGGGLTNNTVTVTWTTAGAKTVSVNYNTAAGCPALTPTVYNVTVNALPVPTITGPSPACSNFPGLVYSTQTGMTGYTWSISAGGVITSGAGTNTIIVTWNATGAQSVCVNYTNANGCTAAAPVCYSVTVNNGAVPTITGSTTLCINSGYYNYTTEAGMTGYTWTISTGGVINFGAGTNVITVSWTASGAQWVRVNYTNPGGCQAYNPTQLNITVNAPPAAAGSITGTATVCGGANGVAYSVAVVSGASTYVWILPAGATIASGANTNSITVNFAANASSGNITVYANNSCGNGAASPPFAITVTPLPADAGTITGPASVCQGAAGMVYTVPAIASATGYIWTVPAGATIVSGANTNSITIDFSPSAVSGNITVLGTNSCGNGTVSPNFAVTVNPIPATPVVTNTGYTAQSSAPAGNQWYYSATQSGTGAPISGATAQTYDATLTGAGYYWSIVTLNGCASDSSNHKLILVTGIDSHSSSAINIYPVPNDGQFTVSITSASNESFSISVYNNLGVKIYEEKNVDVNGSLQKVIDLRPVPNGVYSVIFVNSQKQVVKKIVVNK